MSNVLINRFKTLPRLAARRFFVVAAVADFFGRRAFAREIEAVYSGMRKHHQGRDKGHDVFFIRRHIHMLEKGLSMVPRRDTFGVDYIGELISAVQTSESQGRLDPVTAAWVADTLDAYFEATSSSTSDEIVRARESYAVMKFAGRSPEYLGPVQVGVGVDTLPSYEDILALSHSRQSVRWFEDRAVDRKYVDRAIDVAIQAPSACNRLPYRFIVIDDRDLIGAVASIPGGTKGYVHNIVGLVAVVGDLSAYAHSRDRHLIYVDSSLATMGFLFAMQTQGISTCCINWPDSADADAEMAKVVGLEKYERTVMLVAYGYPLSAGMVPGSGKRHLDSVRTFVNDGGKTA